jgi:hypothetical protein
MNLTQYHIVFFFSSISCAIFCIVLGKPLSITPYILNKHPISSHLRYIHPLSYPSSPLLCWISKYCSLYQHIATICADPIPITATLSLLALVAFQFIFLLPVSMKCHFLSAILIFVLASSISETLIL